MSAINPTLFLVTCYEERRGRMIRHVGSWVKESKSEGNLAPGDEIRIDSVLTVLPKGKEAEAADERADMSVHSRGKQRRARAEPNPQRARITGVRRVGKRTKLSRFQRVWGMKKRAKGSHSGVVEISFEAL